MILKRTYLPTERTLRLLGDGTNVIPLRVRPLLYVKLVQFRVPNQSGFALPLQQLLIDYDNAEILEYTPLMFQGLGYASIFPDGIPIDVTLAHGYNYTIAPPGFTCADVPAQGVGFPNNTTVYVAVTGVRPNGETTATPVPFTTHTGTIQVTVTPTIGFDRYFVYAGVDAGHMYLVATTPSTAYGSQTIATTFMNYNPPANFPSIAMPTTDSSAEPFPPALVEATRLIALEMFWEQNNLANRGVQMIQTGREDIRFRSTAGNSGKGQSYVTDKVDAMLDPLKLHQIF